MKMKKMFFSALAVGAITSVVACNKDNNKPVTTLAKIQAKWNVTSIVIDAGAEDSAYTGIAADYVDFRTDGKVYTDVAGEKDTSLYSLVNDSKLIVDGDTSDIKQLSSSQFVFISKAIIIADTIKTTFTLNK